MSKLDEAVKVQQEAAADDELAVLFPDVDLTVTDPDTGEAVDLTVREFRFREGLECQVIARPLIAALARLAGGIGEGGEGLDTVTVDAVIGGHADIWLTLISRACACEVEWIERLSDAEGRALANAMWEVNGHFFVGRIEEAALSARAVGNLFRSLASSMRSLEPGTAGDTPSSAGG